MIDEMDLIDIFRTFYPNTEEYTFFSSAHGTFSRIDGDQWNIESLCKLIENVCCSSVTSLVAQRLKRLSTMRETRVQYLGWEDPLEKEMAIPSSTIA